MIRILRAVFGAVPYILAVPCALVAPLWIFGIPGNPTTLELTWFLASFTMIVGYPLIVFTLGVKLWRAKRGRSASSPRSLRRQIWGALALLLLVQSPIAVIVYADWRRSVAFWETASPQDHLRRALLMGDLQRVDEILEEGAKIGRQAEYRDMAISPSIFYGEWRVVEKLLDLGADPDYSVTGRMSLRDYLTAAARFVNEENEAAFERIRVRLAAE